MADRGVFQHVGKDEIPCSWNAGCVKRAADVAGRQGRRPVCPARLRGADEGDRLRASTVVRDDVLGVARLDRDVEYLARGHFSGVMAPVMPPSCWSTCPKDGTTASRRYRIRFRQRITLIRLDHHLIAVVEHLRNRAKTRPTPGSPAAANTVCVPVLRRQGFVHRAEDRRRLRRRRARTGGVDAPKAPALQDFRDGFDFDVVVDAVEFRKHVVDIVTRGIVTAGDEEIVDVGVDHRRRRLQDRHSRPAACAARCAPTARPGCTRGSATWSPWRRGCRRKYRASARDHR